MGNMVVPQLGMLQPWKVKRLGGNTVRCADDTVFSMRAERGTRPMAWPSWTEAQLLQGRWRLRRQQGWTSGRPRSPLKASWTRCPQVALSVWPG